MKAIKTLNVSGGELALTNRQRLMAVSCGALAGLTGSVVIAFWDSSFDFSISGLYALLYSLQINALVGIMIGALIGLYMTLRMQEQIWRLHIWTGVGLFSGILSLTHWLFFGLLLWLGARLGISSAGEPSEAIRGIGTILVVGGLAGTIGGFVGGFVFTRYAGSRR